MRLIFVADDSERKLANISDTLEQLYPEARIIESICSRDLLANVRHEFRKEIDEYPDECLIITDMQMPASPHGKIDINRGYTILEKIQNEGIKVPAIIVSSGRVNDKLAKRCYCNYAGSIVYVPYSSQAILYEKTIEHYFKNK